MHKRISDVDDDGNAALPGGKKRVSVDGNSLGSIDARKYASFDTLFHSFKRRRNAAFGGTERTQNLSAAAQGRLKNVFDSNTIGGCMLPSTSSAESSVAKQHFGDKNAIEAGEVSKEVPSDALYGKDLTKVPTSSVQEKLKLFIDRQTASTPATSSSATTSSTQKAPRRAFDLLLDYSRRRMGIDKTRDKSANGEKAVDGTASAAVPATAAASGSSTSNTDQITESIQSLTHESLPSSSILFRGSFEYLTRKSKEEIERIEKDTVTRSLSFDATCSATKKEYVERSSNLGITPVIMQQTDGSTVVHLNGGEQADSRLKQSSERGSDGSKSSSKKEVSFGETTSFEIESNADANASQAELETLRHINKNLAAKLARAEREAQSLQIQLKFYDKTTDAKFACKLADIFKQLKLRLPDDRSRNEAIDILNSLSIDSAADGNNEKYPFLNALLGEIEYEESAALKPETVRENCERLLEYVRKHPPVLRELNNLMDEQNRILQLEGGNPKREIMMKDTANGDLVNGNCENHQIQITSLEANLVLYREQLAMKDVELRRLEEEIGNAHRCNQQLNAKLGSIVTKNGADFRNQERELRKALKERTSECDSLKKKLEKFERDRQQWENQKRALEAKQPLDVQMLQSQKRELTMQLDREQAEKQELFLQINSLIAQLADANRDTLDQQNSNLLKSENETLKKQIADILDIQSQLNTDVHDLQEEVRSKNKEVESAQDESKRLRSIMDSEKARLESSIEELQRDLQMKSAALQSLMLAKQETKTSEADSTMITRLRAENEELRGQIDELRNDIQKRVSEIGDAKLESEKKLASLRSELDSVREDAQKKEADWLSRQNDEASETTQLHEALEKCKSDAEQMTRRLGQSQKDLAECEKKCEALKEEFVIKLQQEKSSAVDANRKLVDELKRQETELNNLKQNLEAQEMRAEEAEKEAKSNRTKLTDLEEELKSLRMQVDERQNVDKQVMLLRDELKHAKQKIIAQAADLEKAETDADEAERSSRETIEELEEEVRTLQEKLKIMEVGEEERKGHLVMVEEERKKHQETSEEYGKKCEALTKDLEDVRAALADSKIILEKFKTENEKLSAKASLEDEVLTLATSLQSARDEISAKQDEITKLRKELRNVHEENERISMDVDEQTQALQQDALSARSECDELKKEMEKCKKNSTALQQESERHLAELTSEISKLKEEMIEKEKDFSSTRSDLELKHQKMLIETKQRCEQQIADLNKQLEEVKASEKEKTDELSAVMTNLRDELISRKAAPPPGRKSGQSPEIESRKEQKMDLDPGTDFEQKLGVLKECIVEIRNQYEEKLPIRSDILPETINAATQTLPQVGDGKHIIAVNDEEEEARERLDNDVLLLKQKIEDFDRMKGDDDRVRKAETSSEVWNLKAELAFLKKRIVDEETDKKRLQKHIQELQSTIRDKEEDLARMDLIKEMEDKKGLESDAVDESVLDVLKFEAIVQQLEGEKRSLQESVDNLQNLLKLAEQDNEETKKALVVAQESQEKITESLEKRLKLTNEEKEKLMKELASIRELNKKFAGDLESGLEIAKEEKGRLEIELAAVRKSSENLTSDFERRLNAVEEERENLKAELAAIRESSKNLIPDFEQRLKSAEEEKEKLRTELAAVRETGEKHKRTVEEKELDIASLKKDVENLTNEVASCKARVTETSHLEGQIAELEFENKNFQNENSSLKAELAELKQQYAEVESEQITKYIDEVEGLSQELRKARQAHEVAGVEMNRLREQSDNLSKEVNHLRNFLNTANTEKEQLKTEAYERRKEVERLSRERVELEVTRQRLEEAIAEGERQAQELAKLKARAKGGEGLERERQQELDDVRQQIRTFEEKWGLERKKNEVEVEAAKKKLMELTEINEASTANIRRLTDQLEAERKRVADSDAEKTRLLNEISQLKTINEQLRSEVDDLRTKSAEEGELSETKEKLNELMAENARLAGELLKERSSQVQIEGQETRKQEVEELLKERDEIWRCKEESLKEGRLQELQKLKEEFERQFKQLDEQWTTNSRNQVVELEKLRMENAELQSERKELLKAKNEFEKQLQQLDSKWTTSSKGQTAEIEKLQMEKAELQSENERLCTEMKGLSESVEQDERTLKEMRKRQERLQEVEENNRQLSEKLKDTEERLKESENNLSRLKVENAAPEPPPRKTTESEIISDAVSQTSLMEENKKLKNDVEMQHRLIVVLRRKLQSMQQQQQRQQQPSP